MPRKITEDEIQQKREELRALDLQGQGLKNPRFRNTLQNLGDFFRNAAGHLEQELTQKDDSRKKKELMLYLKKAGGAFLDLMADNVLENDPEQLEAEKNSKFDEAMRCLSVLPSYLLDRDEKGDLLFSHVERAGKAAAGKAYRRGDLLMNLASLDSLLGMDFGPAAEQIEPELSEEKKQEYLDKGPVLRFRQDPDARMAAELLDPGSEVSTTLHDLIRVLSPWKEDRLLRQNAMALQAVAEQAQTATDPAVIRRAMIQMTQQIKIVRECYEARAFPPGTICLSGSKDNVVFPPDPAKLNLDGADETLMKYFNENVEKIREQVKANTTQTELLVPKNDPLRMLYHLSPQQQDGGAVSPDYAMLNGVIELLIQKGKTFGADAQRKLFNVLQPLSLLRNYLDDHVSGHGDNHFSIKDDSEKVPNLLTTANQRLKEFDEAADDNEKEYVHRMLGLLQQRLANMDVEHVAKEYRDLDMGPAPELKTWERPEPPAEAKPEETLRSYSVWDLNDTRAEMYDGFFSRLVKNSLDDLKAQHEALGVYDADGAKRYVGHEGALHMRWLNGARIRMPGIFKTLEDNYGTGKKTTLDLFNKDRLLEDLQSCATTYRNIAREAGTADADQIEFGKACKKMAESIENAIQKAVEPNRQRDALRAYVAFNSGSHIRAMGEEQKLNAAAKVAAAYQWAEEKHYKPGQKISVSDFSERALEVQKDPCFLEYFRDKKAPAEPAANELQAKPKHKVNGFVLDSATANCRAGAMMNMLRRPLVYGISREEKLQALKELRKYGDVLDHCSGASKKYKKFYYSLKDLSLLDLDRMNSEELGKRLQDVYDKTAQYMKGNKSVSWFKVKREHFEQALDVLSVIQRCGPYGKRMADRLVERTNTVRRHKLRKQPNVELNGRNPNKTVKRLAKCRGIVATEQSRDIIALIEKQLKENKLIRASEAVDVNKLPELPKETENSVKLSTKLEEIQSFLQSGGYNYAGSNARVPEMLALTITPAYRKNGEIVLDEAQYQRNVRVMKQHLAAVDLVREYSYEQKRGMLQANKNANKCGQLRLEFNEKERAINAQIEAQDQKERGAVWKMTAQEERQYLNDEHLKVVKELEERQGLDQANRNLTSKRKEFGIDGPAPEKKTKEEADPSTLAKFRNDLGFDQKQEKPKSAEELQQELQDFKGLGM